MKEARKLMLLICGIIMLYSNSVWSQNENAPNRISVNDLTINSAESIYTDSKIEIVVQKQIIVDGKNGINHERVIFSFVNKTDQALTLDFSKLNMYHGSSSTGEGNIYSVRIEANSTETYSPENKGKTFYSFSKDLKGTIKAELKYIILNNIVVS